MELAKDIFYLIGSILGILGFIRTLKKWDKCEFTYRTEFGDEVKPFLVCIRGDIFNLEIREDESHKSIIALKFPSNTILSRVKYKEVDEKIIDKSSFFPILKETEVLCIPNDNLKMPRVLFSYEDKYHNKYRQTFEFDRTVIGSEERLKSKSRSCYKLSGRRFKFIWFWIPSI